jgi:glutamine amidotransferase
MIAVIDYGMGNLRSVLNAFEAIGHPATLTRSGEDLRRAHAIVLPGVGAFGDGMRNLEALGIVPTLTEEVRVKGKPYLGICLGMQFLASRSLEWGGYPGLGWIPGVVQRLEPAEREAKVPHIGWNELRFPRESVLYAELEEPPVYYFVHSYHFVPATESAQTVTATCWHGETVTASVESGNVYGVQFHPEKSQRVGLRLLRNFAERVAITVAGGASA